MKLDNPIKLDVDRTRAQLSKLLADLRANRLLPLAGVLLVAIVAVPIALSKSSSSTPVAALPQPPRVPPATSALPALSVQSVQSRSRLSGHGRDPFAQQSSGSSSIIPTSSAAATSTATSSAGSSSGAGTTSGTTTGTTSAPVSIQPTTPPPPIVTNPKPKPAPTGLTATQAYDVALTVTNPSGGLDTIDPLVRLSPVPDRQQPLLVELGVLKGGSRVLFAVQPGTVVGGPGTCTPGPIDCEILSLGQDQTEAVGVKSSSGQSSSSLFAITGISARDYPSAAAADKARRAESAAGRAILDASTAISLSLFRYDPSVGAVIDLRNLTVGGQ
jgi:hypothetical protein